MFEIHTTNTLHQTVSAQQQRVRKLADPDALESDLNKCTSRQKNRTRPL
jgi:hypothetical protein